MDLPDLHGARRASAASGALLLAAMVLSGCLRPDWVDDGVALPTVSATSVRAERTIQPVGQRRASDTAHDGTADAPPPTLALPGNGHRVGRVRAAAVQAADNGTIRLDFEATPLVDVARAILGEMLNVNFAIDPTLAGTVSLTTSRPLAESALLPMLETLLRMNGAALTVDDDFYRVVRRDQAAPRMRVRQLGDSSRPLPGGYQVQVVPLRYVGAAQMRDIVAPLLVAGGQLRVDTTRNLLLMTGSRDELTRALEAVDAFDVDWMAGMSVALFTPVHANVDDLADGLEAVFDAAEGGVGDGAMRIERLERQNALLLITPNRGYLRRAERWLARLDRAPRGSGRRLYAYSVQHGRAGDLADVLQQVFGASAEVSRGTEESLAALVAPGETVRRIAVPAVAPAAPGPVPAGLGSAVPPASVGASDGTTTPTRFGSSGSSDDDALRVIADETNNTLLILATPSLYESIERVLTRLDAVPMQVLIEATIAEVTLSDELQHGLEWFFRNGIGSGRGVATLDLGATGIAALAPGFSYAISDAAGVVRAVLNTLASQSRLNVVSSPSVMVLNNQQAEIRVGDEVPVTVQQQQSTVGNSTLVNTIEFRETGVQLRVTPRVNESGTVTMDIEQEVSDVAPGSAATLTPTIQQRQIASTVAIQSGETVVLGGLIRENRTVAESGIPGLIDLPVVGALFGNTNDTARRTELVVLITPRAVRNTEAARAVTDEYRRKLTAPGHFDGAMNQTGQPRRTDGERRR